MMRQALLATVFAAGTLLAGSAMAQTQAPPAQQPMNNWQDQHALRVGNMYTAALNTLYAHGYHGVEHLSMVNGEVQATAITPHGTPQSVTVNPGTGQVSTG